MAVTQVQTSFRVRTDVTPAQGGTPIWAAAANTNPPGFSAFKNFRIRFAISSTGTTTNTANIFQVFASRNSGAYAAVSTVTTFVQAMDATAAGSANQSFITTSLLTGTGTYLAGSAGVGGEYVYGSGSASVTITHGDYTEFEFGLYFTSAVVVGDTYDFQVYFNSIALTTYTVTPRITIVSSGTQVIYAGTDTVSDAGWSNYNLAAIFALANLTADTVDNLIRITIKFGAATVASSTMDELWIGTQGTGNAYNFDGTQIQVKFAGATSVTLAGGAQTLVSDWMAYPSYTASKNFVLRTHLTGTTIDVRVDATLTNLGAVYLAGTSQAGATTPTGTWTSESPNRGYLMMLAEMTSVIVMPRLRQYLRR